MIQIEHITDNFLSLVGWRQSTEKDIEKALTQSDSGLYFNEAHALVSPQNLKSVMPENYANTVEPYDDGTIYSEGARVSYEDEDGTVRIYKAVSDGVTTDPSDAESWLEVSEFSQFVYDKTRQGIKKLVNRFINAKQLNKTGKPLLDRMALFDNAGRFSNFVHKTDRLVGLNLQSLRTLGTTIRIEKIGIQTRDEGGKVTVYLFHSSKETPVASKTVNVTSTNGSFTWADADWVLPYMSDETGAGGEWFILYSQSEMPVNMEAINVAIDFSREPCGTCNKGNLISYRNLTKYMQILPCMSNPIDQWDGSLPPTETFASTPTNNYGLNLVVSVECDLTDFFVSQRNIFANAVQLSVASEVISEIAYNASANVNRYQSNVSAELGGYEVEKLTKELDNAIKALDLSTEGIDRACLCSANKGVVYRSI